LVAAESSARFAAPCVRRPYPCLGTQIRATTAEDLDQLVAAFFGLREPADVVAFVTRYGFLTNRHGDPQRPAQVDVMGLLFRTADLREFRRLALEPLSHLLLDDAQLLDRADTFRGTGSEHSLRPHVLEPRGKRPSGGLRPRCRASRLTPTASVSRGGWRASERP